MKYQVWIIARDPKTLQPIAEVLVFGHEDRPTAGLYSEYFTCIAENAARLFGPLVLGQNPIYGTETRARDDGPVFVLGGAKLAPDTRRAEDEWRGIEELPIGWSMSWTPGEVDPADPAPVAHPPFPRI